MLLYYFQIIIFDTWLVYCSFKNLTLEIGESDVKQHLLLLSVLGRHRNIMIYFAFFFLQFCWVLFSAKQKWTLVHIQIFGFWRFGVDLFLHMNILLLARLDPLTTHTDRKKKEKQRQTLLNPHASCLLLSDLNSQKLAQPVTLPQGRQTGKRTPYCCRPISFLLNRNSLPRV